MFCFDSNENSFSSARNRLYRYRRPLARADRLTADEEALCRGLEIKDARRVHTVAVFAISVEVPAEQSSGTGLLSRVAIVYHRTFPRVIPS